MSIRPYQFSITFLDRELDSLFAEMEARACALMNQVGASILPAAVKSGNYSVFDSDIHVDLCENENEIVVVTDLPGVEKENISIKLLNPETLMIKADRQSETEGGAGVTYHLRERRASSMHKNIHLPAAVRVEGAKASFKNGVLEITLQKEREEEGTGITIE
ncbi:MAG TPA: Hsp20/alpha crystallin family protein [Methanocorpusculum sp.]|nr:Hsp20/alpha crystallin family protein [Methanocorpusculum sp.]